MSTVMSSYKFEESAGTIAFDSVGTNHGYYENIEFGDQDLKSYKNEVGYSKAVFSNGSTTEITGLSTSYDLSTFTITLKGYSNADYTTGSADDVLFTVKTSGSYPFVFGLSANYNGFFIGFSDALYQSDSDVTADFSYKELDIEISYDGSDWSITQNGVSYTLESSLVSVTSDNVNSVFGVIASSSFTNSGFVGCIENLAVSDSWIAYNTIDSGFTTQTDATTIHIPKRDNVANIDALGNSLEYRGKVHYTGLADDSGLDGQRVFYSTDTTEININKDNAPALVQAGFPDDEYYTYSELISKINWTTIFADVSKVGQYKNFLVYSEEVPYSSRRSLYDFLNYDPIYLIEQGEPVGNYTFERSSASPACINADGSLTYLAANVPEYDYIDGQRYYRHHGQYSQYFDNAGDSPATQSITLAAGTYTMWCEGSGSIEYNGNTATAGSPVTFTLASSTTDNATVTGDVTFSQINNGSYVQPRIDTDGTVPITVDTCASDATGHGLRWNITDRMRDILDGRADGAEKISLNAWVPVQSTWSVGGDVLTVENGGYADTIKQNIGYIADEYVRIRADVTVSSGRLSLWLGGTAVNDYMVAYFTADAAVDIRISVAEYTSFNGSLYWRSLDGGTATNATVSGTSVVGISPAVGSLHVRGWRPISAIADTAQNSGVLSCSSVIANLLYLLPNISSVFSYDRSSALSGSGVTNQSDNDVDVVWSSSTMSMLINGDLKSTVAFDGSWNPTTILSAFLSNEYTHYIRDMWLSPNAA